jgi:uracil DNA glycosylase
MFFAMEHFDFQDTKVVIIGQDPAHGVDNLGAAIHTRESTPSRGRIIKALIDAELLDAAREPDVLSNGSLLGWINQS